MTIRFNQPFATGNELGYVQQAIDAGRLAGDGAFTRRCQTLLQEMTGSPQVLLTHSCTAALEMAAILANVGPGDEVIMPSYTFVSTANAFVLRGATPVFVDIRPDTLNLNEDLIAAAVTHHTRAIVPVHYAGVGCEMDAIMEIATDRNLVVIEDAAQGVGATYRDRPLGAIGHLGTFSFHETKNVVCGEGGALLINDATLAERAEIIWEKGTNRSQFFRGQVDKYTWVDLGSSFLPSELIAAYLLAQLEDERDITARRRQVWERYYAKTAGLEAAGIARRPQSPPHCTHNAHMFQLVFSAPGDRDRVMRALNKDGINAVFHYVPLHDAPVGRRVGRAEGALPVTQETSASLLRLPLWIGLADGDIDAICARIGEVAG